MPRADIGGALRGHTLAAGGALLVTLIAFLPALDNGFVNWDDPTVIVNNPDLGSSHAVSWAFTTTLVGHYQPIAWLVWSGLTAVFGVAPRAFHALSLLTHALNTLLVYVVAWRLASFTRLDARDRVVVAAVASALFGVHPVRVETVAWASAFPYALSLACLLCAFLAYLHYCSLWRRTSVLRVRAWLGLSLAGYAAALLARATAIGFPLVLLLVDVYPLRRRVSVRRLLIEKLPFAAVSLGAVLVESRAREIASLQDVALGARITMAVTAPFVYLGRTLWPVSLTPLDPLPIAPVTVWLPLVAGLAGLVTISIVAWTLRQRWPALLAAWIAYLVLLAPVAGLTPSGLQATADRYVYIPGVVLSLLLASCVAAVGPPEGGPYVRVGSAFRLRRRLRRTTVALAEVVRRAVPVFVVVVVAALGALTWRQTLWWRDSIALWTRVLSLDPNNDVATYNLAIALADAGRDEEAMRQYEATLRLVPDQTLARRSLTALQAKQAGRAADRGIELVRLGRTREAVGELRTAYDANLRDAPVLNAFAFSLMDTGRAADAVAILKQGVARYPDDIDMAHNLARLLATAEDDRIRDNELALRLALDVDRRTGGRDPRALDTLAAAYAASGRPDLARETSRKAIGRARELGDADLEREITARARRYAQR